MKIGKKLLVSILAAGIILGSIAGVSIAAVKDGKTNTAQCSIGCSMKAGSCGHTVTSCSMKAGSFGCAAH